jgi:hypothetical protein
MVSPAPRVCRICRELFVIGADELATLREIAARAGWSGDWAPRVCSDCRFLARRTKTAATATGSDARLTCVDCRASFIFTASEQKAYAARGHRTPRRCRRCRSVRAAQ